MITFLAPAAMCLRASSALVNRPVDSTTTSTPSSPQGRSAGSRSARILSGWPPTRIVSPSAVTSCGRLPSTLSYLSRCAMVATSPRSFAATICMSSPAPPLTARQKFRPIRPNPLMPTRMVTAAFSSHVLILFARHPAAAQSPGPTLPDPLHEHVRGEPGLGAGDAELLGPPVRHGQQPPDPPGDRVLGHRRFGELTELFQARLPVRDAQPARVAQVLRRVVAENLQRALDPRARGHCRPGTAPQV